MARAISVGSKVVTLAPAFMDHVATLFSGTVVPFWVSEVLILAALCCNPPWVST
jgi:hypothetical protein